MHGFKCFYNGREWETHAESLYAAKLAAVAYFKAPKSKSHMVSVVLCERPDGSTVTHSTAGV